MTCDHGTSRASHLFWVYPGSLADALDSATWLDTTRELRQLGWRVTLAAAGPAGRQLVRGVQVFCIAKPEVYLFGQVLFHMRLLRLFLKQRATIDVILFHQMSAPWLLPLRFVRGLINRERPLLVMDTRTLPMSTATSKDRLRALFYRLMNRLANRYADGQTAITQRMAKTVGIPSQQLWGTWPSGVDTARFAAAQIVRRWPVEGEPIHLVYIGHLGRERNLMSLCRAMEKGNSEGMAFVLSLVGDSKDPEQLGLEKFARQTKGRVRLIPPVAHDQVPNLLAQAHVGVLPFPDKEIFRVSSPIKLFEYMSAGLPVLATRIVSHTDVLGSGEYAFWAKDGSVEGLLAAMRLIWRGSSSLERMGRQAAIAAQAWTWQESATKLKNALENGIAEVSQVRGRRARGKSHHILNRLPSLPSDDGSRSSEEEASHCEKRKRTGSHRHPSSR